MGANLITSKQKTAFLKLKKCKKCKKRVKLERHHITYKPEIVVNICVKCHKKITRLNTEASQSTSPWHRLTNIERVFIWFKFNGI